MKFVIFKVVSCSISIDVVSDFEEDLPSRSSNVRDFVEPLVPSGSWVNSAQEQGKGEVGRRLVRLHNQVIGVERQRQELDARNALRMRWTFRMIRWLEDAHGMTKRRIAKEFGKFVQ